MGLFWSSAKPGVSRTEFKERVMSHLSHNNWSDSDRARVKMVFAGHLEESGSDAGIDKKEIEEGIKTLKKTREISDERLEDLRQYMMNLV